MHSYLILALRGLFPLIIQGTASELLNYKVPISDFREKYSLYHTCFTEVCKVFTLSNCPAWYRRLFLSSSA